MNCGGGEHKRNTRVAILADVHGNLPALQAVLKEMAGERVDDVVVLGDIVGYGASPSVCVDIIRELGALVVRGNHDEEVVMTRRRGCTFRDPSWRSSPYLAGLGHSATALSDEQIQWLAALALRARRYGAEFAHGSLDEPGAFHCIEDWGSAEPTLELLRKERSAVGFFGHSHCQAIFTKANECLWKAQHEVKLPDLTPCAVTVGSVGRPGHDPECRAAWVLWTVDERIVEFRKTEYDRIAAARDVAQAGLPMESSIVLLTGAEVRRQVWRL